MNLVSNVDYMKRAIEVTSALERRFNQDELGKIFGVVNPRAGALMMARVVREHYFDGVEVTINKLLVAIADMAKKGANGA